MEENFCKLGILVWGINLKHIGKNNGIYLIACLENNCEPGMVACASKLHPMKPLGLGIVVQVLLGVT